MTEIKICGLTRPEDVELACRLGAAYVGFVFSAVSPRRVSLELSRELAQASGPGVVRVGVFVDEEYPFIAKAIEAARLDLAQIHRPLKEEDLSNIAVPVMTVAQVRGGVARVPAPAVLARCRSILFDTVAGERGGGTGTCFDWTELAGRVFPVPLFLAGGLNDENVGEAIARVGPSAVDVASGVEAAPGIKDPAKMERFFQAVREADERAGRESDSPSRVEE
jgi:phosphoribosylanthranilate isomerase